MHEKLEFTHEAVRGFSTELGARLQDRPTPDYLA